MKLVLTLSLPRGPVQNNLLHFEGLSSPACTSTCTSTCTCTRSGCCKCKGDECRRSGENVFVTVTDVSAATVQYVMDLIYAGRCRNKPCRPTTPYLDVKT